MEDVKDHFGESNLSNAEFNKAHDEDEIDDAKNELMDQQREIIWGTLFEAKDQMLADKILENSDAIINNAGFTIVDVSKKDEEGAYGTGIFLGVNGAGYDFYEQHWVPLYRILGWIQMKGFKDPQGKFRPTENKNGVRMSRDQSAKTQGVKFSQPRMQREISIQKLPDVNLHRHYWGFNTEDGKIEGLHLGNLSDAGFYWHGSKDSINHFLAMMSRSKVEKEFRDSMKEVEITLDMLKPQMLANVSGKLVDDETDDGLYALSGGDTVWKFGDIPEVDLDSEFSGWDYFGDGKEFTREEKELIEEKFWYKFNDIGYEDFLKKKGEEWRSWLIKTIKNANDLDDLFTEFDSEDVIYMRFEMYDELRRPKIDEAIHESIKELQKEDKLRKK